MKIQKDKKAILSIIAIVLIVIILMLPLRAQVTGDDFAYAQSVRHFVNTGQIKISEAVGPSLIFQLIWGGIFSKILGFSLITLHISVIFFLPILCVYLYKLLREFEISASKSIVFTLIFLSIPWILFYTYTFSTDIPYLTLQILSSFYYVKGIINLQNRNLLIGSIFASCALITRQIGIVLPVSVFLTILFFTKLSLSEKLKKIFVAVLIPSLTICLYLLWLSNPNNITIPQIKYNNEFKKTLLNLVSFNPELYKIIIHRFLNQISQTMGILISMAILLVLSNIKIVKNILLRRWKLFIFSTFIGGCFYLVDILWFPGKIYLGYPLLMYENELLFPVPWAKIWKILVAVSIPFWAAIISLSLFNIRKIRAEQFFLLCMLIGLSFLTLTSIFAWNKYILPFLPIIIIFLGIKTTELKINKKLAFVFVILLIVDSLQIEKISYEENGIAQALGFSLVNRGVAPQNIIIMKNYDWSFWFNYEELSQKEISKVDGDKRLAQLPQLEFERDYKYIITTERNLKYLPKSLYNNALIEKKTLRNLFVKTELLIIKND